MWSWWWGWWWWECVRIFFWLREVEFIEGEVEVLSEGIRDKGEGEGTTDKGEGEGTKDKGKGEGESTTNKG